MDREQHFLSDLGPFRDVLAGLPLAGRRVLEIGAGKGAVTGLLLEAGAHVVAFEIERGLCPLRHPNLQLIEEDVLKRPLSEITWDCMISAPPYSLLFFLRAVLDVVSTDAVLMIPMSKRSMFAEFTIEASYGGEAFDPPSRGKHLIVRKGFRR